MGSALGQDVEGEGLQGIAGEDRGRLVEGLVHGRPAAAQIIIVHGRQVVMDERIAVDAFERGTHPSGRAGAALEELGALEKQERPQSLAGAEAA